MSQDLATWAPSPVPDLAPPRAPAGPALRSTAAQVLLLGGTLGSLAMGAFGDRPGPTLGIMVAVGLAAVISSTVGFAHSAIAGVVVYRLAESPREAVTILMACSLSIQAYSLAQFWRSISWRQFSRVLAGGLLTLTPGCWLSLHTPTRSYLTGLGAFLAVYGAAMLWTRPRPAAVSPRLAPLGDVLAGALGGLTGPLAAFPSLPVTVWLAHTCQDKVRQRSVYQPFIVVIQLGALAVRAAMGGGNPVRLDVAGVVLPALLGCTLGLDIFRRLSTARFTALVYAMIAVSGAALALR
jgi:uncharacterized membrane protein YfcA